MSFTRQDISETRCHNKKGPVIHPRQSNPVGEGTWNRVSDTEHSGHGIGAQLHPKSLSLNTFLLLCIEMIFPGDIQYRVIL